jgi:ribonucleoside-diphosphate reductase alpha chain
MEKDIINGIQMPSVNNMSDTVVDSILKARYLRAGESSFEDICRRVAMALAESPEDEQLFFNEMRTLRFLPNSPTLMNAGTELGQLSACFTLKVGDSISEIFNALEWGALIHKSGGGTGYNFSSIRPEGAPVQSTEGVASGPVSFMKIFNAATEVIKQGGRRRGANMGILNVWHPDIMTFIKAKTEEGEISNFNISVMLNDKFMGLVESGELESQWVVHPHTGAAVTVGEIWDGIVDGIWKNGEPGVLFYDAINNGNPTPNLGPIDTTNPCGEQPLLHFESCVLGSINLSKYVASDTVDYQALDETSRMAVRFLDAVIDKNKFPIEPIEEATRKTRKIGLGIMGMHDMLLALGIPYDSPEGRGLCGDIMDRITRIAAEESSRIAAEKGSFPAWQGSIWGTTPMRNAALTTVAPTGTISLLAGCSSGIEPIFSYAYTRKNTVGKTFDIIHPVFFEELEKTINAAGFSGFEAERRKQAVMEHVHKTGTIQDIAWLPDHFRRLFKTALDIAWEDHVLMQAALQPHVHASISKTINMPNESTRDDVAKAIIMAWHAGLKGMTIYRTGSREDVVLSLKEDAKAPERPPGFRPKELEGKTYLCSSGCCRLYITINLLDGAPWEVFIRTVGQGGCEANSNALGRSISTGLQNGVPYQKFVRQLGKVSCIAALKNSKSEGISCADVVGKCIELAARGMSVTTLEDWNIQTVKAAPTCPECGSSLDFGEGCNQGICKTCGWSGCS